jgi:hypothetical protein
MIRFTIPIHTVSESNMAEHWTVKAKRAKKQREAAYLFALQSIGMVCLSPNGRLTITLTRIAPRKLDDGNNSVSMKHAQDGLCDALGIDDGDEILSWVYAQRRGKAKEYAVEVQIQPKEAQNDQAQTE